MNQTIEALRSWGCDIDAAMGRLLGDEELFLELSHRVADGDECGRLTQAVEAGDAKESFEVAHMLKGMLGNMGMTPIYRPVCEIVDRLRGGQMTDVTAELTQIQQGYEQLRKLLSK